jgi:glucosamine--fructose-6-phosphate aminotransferase (isomerizing)
MLEEIWDQVEVTENILNRDSAEIEHFSRRLFRSGNLVLLGTGASLNACLAAKYVFMQYPCILPNIMEASIIPHAVKSIPSGTPAAIISQSGNSLETCLALDTCSGADVAVTGITNNPESYLAEHAQKIIQLDAGEEVSSATKTYSATILVLYLAACMKNQAAMQDLNKIPVTLKKCLKACTSQIAKLAGKLKNCRSLYLGGMGPYGDTARQGALLIKEKDFIHAEGMSISELRHGTIESIDKTTPVIIICHDSQYSEAAEHGNYLQKTTEASVCLMVNGENQMIASSEPDMDIIQVPNLGNETLGHICAAVPLQLLSEEIAFQMGYDIDGFRYIRKVIDTYGKT